MSLFSTLSTRIPQRFWSLRARLGKWLDKKMDGLNHWGRARWKAYKPKVTNLLNYSVAVSTATATMRTSIEILPILISVFTFLSAAPLLNLIIPMNFMGSGLSYCMFGGFSIYAGYAKYQELVLRAQLDFQIRENTKQLEDHTKEIASLKKGLAHSEGEKENTPAPAKILMFRQKPEDRVRSTKTALSNDPTQEKPSQKRKRL